MTWLKSNLIQILIILGGITFGYANFTKNIEVNATDIKRVENRVDKYEEKIDKGLLLLERIDERTKKYERR
jgi:hypothetical protein